MALDIKELALVAWGALGMTMWAITQLRLTRVENRVSKRVVKAADDTRIAAVDAVLGMEKRVDGATQRMEAAINTKLQDVSAHIDAKLEDVEVPEFDLEPLTQRFDALEERLPKEIATHIGMAMTRLEVQEAKKVKMLLEELDLEGIAEEQRAEVVSKMTTRQKAGLRLMTMKIPKSARDQNPLAVAVFDEARVLVGQALVDSEEPVGGSMIARRSSGSSGSFRPGMRR